VTKPLRYVQGLLKSLDQTGSCAYIPWRKHVAIPQNRHRGGGGNWALSAYLEDRQTQAFSKIKCVPLQIPPKQKQTPWPESTSAIYRPSDRLLSAKLVPTFAHRGCHVVSVTDPYGRNLGFLDRSCYFFFQVAPQL
jgi:hypothetical protein